MKTRIRTLLTISFLLYAGLILHAQMIGTPIERAQMALLHSEFIFEGVVTDQEFFKDANGSIWTSNEVTITRIFKGTDSLFCNRVLIINRGSAGKWIDFGNGPENGGQGSHTFEYYMNQRGIFFCKKSISTPAPPTNTTPNSITLQSTFEALGTFLNYQYDPRILDTLSLGTVNNFASGFLGLSFSSFNEVQDYLKSGYGIDTSEFVKCRPVPTLKKKSNDDRPVLVNPRNTNRDKKKAPQDQNDKGKGGNNEMLNTEESIDDNALLHELKKKRIREYESLINWRINNCVVSERNSRAGEELTFSLANEKFTGSSPRYFEFDILVSANQTGTYLDNAPVHLSYNTSAFGSNIAANNKIIVTKASSFRINGLASD